MHVVPMMAEQFLTGADESSLVLPEVPAERVAIALGVIVALTFLFCADWSDNPVVPVSLGP